VTLSDLFFIAGKNPNSSILFHNANHGLAELPNRSCDLAIQDLFQCPAENGKVIYKDAFGMANIERGDSEFTRHRFSRITPI